MKRSKPISTVLVLLILSWSVSFPFSPARAQGTGASRESDLDHVRQLLEIEKDYETGRTLLNQVIEDETANIPGKQLAYILLVEMYVLRANDFESENDDQAADGMRALAIAEIRNCLSHEELRHTRPEESEHPEVVDLFAQERGKMFGSFTVSSLIPSHATVTFDDVVLVSPDGGLPQEESVYPGPKTIKVTAEGYSPIVEQLDVFAGQNVVRAFKLDKKKGWKRYLFPGVALAGVVGLVVGLSGGGSDGGEEPLPGPPPPPGQ